MSADRMPSYAEPHHSSVSSHCPMSNPSGSTPNRQRGLLTAVICVLLLGLAILPLVALAADPATEAEYQKRFRALDREDVSGHVDLALWCRDQEAYDLLLRQCTHILTIDSDNEMATLLLELAKSKLPERETGTQGGGQSDGRPADRAPAQGKLKLLTDEQVQVIKREVLMLNRPERITVRFHNDVQERFWNYMAARENLGPRDKVVYNRTRPTELAKAILQRIQQYEKMASDQNPFEDNFSQDIEITNDPLVMQEFRTRVWPIILNGCATAKCHGGAGAERMPLYTDRNMTDNMHYTNFFILHEYAVGDMEVIDRDFPDKSLLLLYGQPTNEESKITHPTSIPEVFRTPRDPSYQRVLNWIRVLTPPDPDFGFTLDDLQG